jgi:hypothetical protein
VNCPPYFYADWATAISEEHGRRVMDEYGRAVESKAPRGPGVSVRRDDMRCKLAGTVTTCARVHYDAPGEHIVQMWGMARVKGQVLFANCAAQNGAPMLPPCSLVVSGD